MSDTLDENQELCVDFVVESREMLAEIEPILVEIEAEATTSGEIDIAEIDKIFRAFHSMKGSGGFLDLDNVVSVTHEMESLLDQFRKGHSTLEPRHITVICSAMDFILDLIDQVESEFHDGGHEESADLLVASIRDVMNTPEAESESSSNDAEAAQASSEVESPEQRQDVSVAVQVGTEASQVLDDDLARTLEEAGERSPEGKNGAVAEAEAVEESVTAPMDSPSESSEKKRKPPAGNIRVDLEKLDSLMDLVGELILAETMVTHNPDLEGYHFEDFQKASLQLNRITRAIQDIAMSVRMVPISGTFRKMLRLVRDLSQKQQKQVELILVGEETEIDKTVVEAIADPLVHIVRNSIDHGIETEEVRIAAGKPACGRIRLEAKQEGGEIWITIADDGKGLDRDAILAKAEAKGLVDSSRGEPTDSDIYQFIFAAGFSTAAKVTDVSGRGVGMDVVRRNIDKLGGRVDVDSTQGQGSEITIRLPLTLAIVEGMLVRVGTSVYTIPLLAIRESISADPNDVTRLADRQEMVNVRGRLLPILRIEELHEIPDAERDLEKGILVVVEEHGSSFAIFVDELIGQRQTVIKALPTYLGKLRGVSGCSILSDGNISLILDVKALQSEWATAGAES